MVRIMEDFLRISEFTSGLDIEEIVVNNRLIAAMKPILKGNEITNNVQIQNGLRIYSEIILASFFTHIYFFCIFINICFIMIL